MISTIIATLLIALHTLFGSPLPPGDEVQTGECGYYTFTTPPPACQDAP